MKKISYLTILILTLGLLQACSDSEEPVEETEVVEESLHDEDSEMVGQNLLPGRRFTGGLDMIEEYVSRSPEVNATRNAYFGDLHVHTRYSFDAYVFGTIATPQDAYRYARGEKIKHPAGTDVQLRQPLDFYAVTDHAMFIGAMAQAADTASEFSKYDHVQEMHDINAPDNRGIDSIDGRAKAFASFLAPTIQGIADGSISVDMVNDIGKDAWANIIDAADAYYEPGEFTTFVGYEYTSSTDDMGNLHRNVIFRGSDRLPALPFSRFHSQDPEGLWDWMDQLREKGIESLAIPHNSNGSNGQMFTLTDWAGDPMDENYVSKRIRNEPLIEITQIKGTSETHPELSPDDEWADFEIMPYRVATSINSAVKGSYVREALLNGLGFEEKEMTNPYRFGFIGSSDTHTGAISDDESEFFMKIGILDSTAELRGSVPLTGEAEERAWAAIGQEQPNVGVNLQRFVQVDEDIYRDNASITWGASGLAAVWAEENTRESIYDAFRRKETFATSGTRLRVRLFAGHDFDAAMLDDPGMIEKAYASGVPMGGELIAGEDAPAFIALAYRDPMSAPLDRLQVVKGWTVNGEHHEQVYDVACSDDGEVDPATNRCPDNGASVELSDCSYSQLVGDNTLSAVWRDPDYNADHHAFYYVRALENPTCRWSTWDAIRAGVEPRPGQHATIQERAWTSPVWVRP